MVTCTGFPKILRFQFKFQFYTCVFTRSIHVEGIVLFVFYEIFLCLSKILLYILLVLLPVNSNNVLKSCQKYF